MKLERNQGYCVLKSFCARLPLPDGRVNFTDLLSGYTIPDFAIAAEGLK